MATTWGGDVEQGTSFLVPERLLIEESTAQPTGAARSKETMVQGTTRSSGRLLATVAIAAIATAAAGFTFAAGAGTATAPEPAQLTYDLSGDWQHATWMGDHTCNAVQCGGKTYGFHLPEVWINHSWMGAYAGYPCINYPARAGTTLPGVIVNYPGSNWVRCQLP